MRSTAAWLLAPVSRRASSRLEKDQLIKIGGLTGQIKRNLVILKNEKSQELGRWNGMVKQLAAEILELRRVIMDHSIQAYPRADRGLFVTMDAKNVANRYVGKYLRDLADMINNLPETSASPSEVTRAQVLSNIAGIMAEIDNWQDLVVVHQQQQQPSQQQQAAAASIVNASTLPPGTALQTQMQANAYHQTLIDASKQSQTHFPLHSVQPPPHHWQAVELQRSLHSRQSLHPSPRYFSTPDLQQHFTRENHANILTDVQTAVKKTSNGSGIHEAHAAIMKYSQTIGHDYFTVTNWDTIYEGGNVQMTYEQAVVACRLLFFEHGINPRIVFHRDAQHPSFVIVKQGEKYETGGFPMTRRGVEFFSHILQTPSETYSIIPYQRPVAH